MEYRRGVYFIGLPFIFFLSDHIHSAASEDVWGWGTRYFRGGSARGSYF